VNTVEEILNRALQLPEKDRATIAHGLLRSLDEDEPEISEVEWDVAWAAEVQARAALLRNGTGANLSATWRSGSVIRTGSDLDADTAGRLFFSDFASVDMRLFANLDQQSLIRPPNWLRGTRITLSVDNLFDSRPRVRDETGQTPLGYQPAYLDPLGRTFMIGLRKLFS
jgi:iron complex outermembrane recepter protein